MRKKGKGKINSPTRDKQQKADIYSNSPKNQKQPAKYSNKQGDALARSDPTVLNSMLKPYQDLQQLSMDLLSVLKQVERGAEYDQENSEIFTEWTDIRQITDMTQ